MCCIGFMSLLRTLLLLLGGLLPALAVGQTYFNYRYSLTNGPPRYSALPTNCGSTSCKLVLVNTEVVAAV